MSRAALGKAMRTEDVFELMRAQSYGYVLAAAIAFRARMERGF